MVDELADAVAAEERGDARRGDVEGDVLDDLLAGDPRMEAADGQDGGHTVSPR